ncbi:MAG TPA: nucleoside triphosphate pyrophosphohydrolase [Oculatellaceae cyanobacterium]
MPVSKNLDAFIETIARLRAPDGCPWDREQTHESLARFLLEETYEVLEAIHEGDQEKLKEELGDLLLQIVLNAQVAKDDGRFDIDEVAKGINEKMIKRHPHVFSDTKAENADAVLKQWDELKNEEKKEKEAKGVNNSDGNAKTSILDGIPKTLPALMQTLKISEKAVNQGFEWQQEEQIWQQLHSELDELKEALRHEKFEKKSHDSKEYRDAQLELGDVLFTVVNIARWHSMNPEECLLLANDKFKGRFKQMEQLADKPLKKLSFEEYEKLWLQAKKEVATG